MTSAGLSSVRWRARLLLIALAPMISAATGAATARAEPSSVEPSRSIAAEVLFEQGRQEMAKGEFAKACAKLDESQHLAPAPGTAFNLADCFVHIGRLASAWSLFRDVEAETRLAGQRARAEAAGRRAAELEPTLPRIRIDLVEPSDAVEVRRDGAPVGRAQWSVDVPVDLGEHAVTATAPGKKSWHTTLNIARPGEVAVISVPALGPLANPVAPAPAPAPATVVAEAAPAVAAAPQPPVAVADLAPAPSAADHTIALVIGVSGVGLLVASGVTVAIAKSIWDGAAPCPGSICPTQDAVNTRDRARKWGDVATGLGIAGGVGVGVGAVLWLIESHRVPADGTTARRSDWDVAARANGIELRGSW